jgi:hypothetical protein
VITITALVAVFTSIPTTHIIPPHEFIAPRAFPAATGASLADATCQAITGTGEATATAWALSAPPAAPTLYPKITIITDVEARIRIPAPAFPAIPAEVLLLTACFAEPANAAQARCLFMAPVTDIHFYPDVLKK